MSSKGERTRLAALNAAAELLRTHGAALITMADVAARCGLTRQALYLHFPTRTRLMVALIDHVGREAGKVELFGAVAKQRRPRQALDAALTASARYWARIYPVALALDVARHSDSDARAAWDDRMQFRRRRMAKLVARLATEGRLRQGWSVRSATDALWTLSSPRGYADFVLERGGSFANYQRYLLTAAGAFFTTPG